MDESTCTASIGGFAMDSILNSYVQRITAEIDGTTVEKADIAEELLTHLQMLRADLIAKGKTELEADHLAIQHFGGSASIGKEMQQAMYPYRNKALLFLGIVSLFNAFTLYTTVLLLERDAHISWLLSMVATSILLLPISIGVWPRLKRKTWLAFLLIMHLLFLGYGALIGGTIDHGISLLFQWGLLLVMLVSFILLYRIIIFDYGAHSTVMRWIHLLNMTMGIVYTGIMFFALWVLLAFFDKAHPIAYVGSLMPVLFWCLLYYGQLHFFKRGKQIPAYILAVVSFVMLLLLVWEFLR